MTERVGAVILLRKDGAALLHLRDCKAGLRNAGMWVPPYLMNIWDMASHAAKKKE